MILLVGVPAIGAHFDERDAGLDEASSQQAALTERCLTVGRAELRGLLVEPERLHPQDDFGQICPLDFRLRKARALREAGVKVSLEASPPKLGALMTALDQAFP